MCNVGMLFWVWLISSPLLSAATLTAVTSLAPLWLCALLTAKRCCKGGNVGELSAVTLFCFVCLFQKACGS